MSLARSSAAGIWRKPSGATSWSVPQFDEAEVVSASSSDVETPPQPPTAAEIEQIRQAAREEGFAQGLAEGERAGRLQAQADREALCRIAAQMARPLAELDGEIERALANLALSMARRMVGQAVEKDDETLRALVHRVVSHLGSLKSPVDVEVAPQDLVRLQTLPDLDQYWQLQANAELQSGDVIVRQADTEIDGRLQRRIESLAADMLDGH
ncbi:MAG: FliH/SctL family protein [Oceanococcaceae bacterium]